MSVSAKLNNSVRGRSRQQLPVHGMPMQVSNKQDTGLKEESANTSVK